MSTRSNTPLYDALDKKGKEAAEEWFIRMAPALEDGSQEWLGQRPQFSAEEIEVYNEIVHPVLLWRFFFHLSAILAEASEGWQEMYARNSGRRLNTDGDS